MSLAMPGAPSADPALRIDWNPLRSTLAAIRAARESRTVFLSVLGNSWFWFYGALVLAQLPLFVKTVLNGSEEVVTLFLFVFSAGVGVGSLLCEKLSGGKVEIGLVPFGSIGLTVFALDIALASPQVPSVASLGVSAFLERPVAWRIVMDLGSSGSSAASSSCRFSHHAAALAAGGGVARHQRQQHSECALHGGGGAVGAVASAMG
jgi:hypothetical protein